MALKNRFRVGGHLKKGSKIPGETAVNGAPMGFWMLFFQAGLSADDAVQDPCRNKGGDDVVGSEIHCGKGLVSGFKFR